MLDKKYLGEFIEERDGVKCIVKKWEKVTPLSEHNARVDAQVAKLQAEKIDSKVALGELVKESIK